MSSTQHKLLDPEHLAKIKALHIRARTVMDGALTGLHRSPHHGSSIEFAEHHEYSTGDEIRHIDWRVYARSDKYYVKRFEHETDLRAMTLIDASSSMSYQSDAAVMSKWEYSAVLAASLSYLLLRQQDAVGLLISDQQVRCYAPPRSRMSHLMHLCEQLTLNPPGNNVGTALNVGTDYLADVVGRRGLIFVISDFLDVDASYFQTLKQLKSRQQHIHLVQVLDPWELRFPFQETTVFRSLESSDQLLAEPQAMRQVYLREMKAFIRSLRRRCLEAGMDYRLVDTGVPLEDSLRNLIAPVQPSEV